MIKQCAEMGATKVMAKLSEGAMISQDACYPHKCTTGFTNFFTSFVNDYNQTGEKIKRKDFWIILKKL